MNHFYTCFYFAKNKIQVDIAYWGIELFQFVKLIFSVWECAWRKTRSSFIPIEMNQWKVYWNVSGKKETRKYSKLRKGVR